MVLHDLSILLEGTQLPGWMPLAVAFVLFAALVWLWLSMRVHLKRADYPDEPVADEDAPEGVEPGEATATSPASPDPAAQA
ncbi:MAG: hypothetical protein ACK5LS_05795 [Propioniciclava sp.]